MNFLLSTEDIQKLTISVICSDAHTVTPDDKRKLLDILSRMNWMCKAENDYEVEVVVKG